MYVNRHNDYLRKNPLRFEITYSLATPGMSDDQSTSQSVGADFYNRIIETMDSVGICGSVSTRVLSDSRGGMLVRMADSGLGLPNTSVAQFLLLLYRSVTENIGMGVPVCTRMVVLPSGKIKVDLQLEAASMTMTDLPELCYEVLAG